MAGACRLGSPREGVVQPPMPGPFDKGRSEAQTSLARGLSCGAEQTAIRLGVCPRGADWALRLHFCKEETLHLSVKVTCT